MSLTDKFVRCVKSMPGNESRAIAICTKSVLWSKGKTIKRFYTTKKGKLRLVTQKRRSASFK